MIPLFFVTALIYSMAGLAGGSTYLALLVLFSVPYEIVPKVALLCNIIVSAGGSYFFFRAGHLSVRRVLPFFITSIPAALLGGRIPIEKGPFQILLGVSLFLVAVRMFLWGAPKEGHHCISPRRAWVIGLPLGVLLGALSGLVGIGGGIFLIPSLLVLGWADVREAAGASSLFILVNSLAGLVGQWLKNPSPLDGSFLIPLAAAVFLGGQIGSRLGSRKIPKLALQRLAAILVFTASCRLLVPLLF